MANTIFEIKMIAEMINAKMGDGIVLYQLANVHEMEANAGKTIEVPTTQYIGMADDVAELQDIDIADLVQGTTTIEVKKVGKGLEFSVEQINNAYVDVNELAEKQLVACVNDKLEKDLFDLLANNTNRKVTVPAIDVDGVADALVAFGEDDGEGAVMLVHPKALATLRKDDNFLAVNNGEVKGAGEIFGCTVMASNRVPEGKAYFVKQGALAVYVKADTLVETDKNIKNQSEMIVATKHYAVAIENETLIAIAEVQ